MHWGFGFWPLLPLFWIGIVALFCWGVSRWFGWRDRRGPISAPFDAPFEPDALEILIVQLVTLLRDARYEDHEIVDWLFREDVSLPGTPIHALRENRGAEVKRRAQVAGY